MSYPVREHTTFLRVPAQDVVRWRTDSNRRNRFCRPMPRLSATPPYLFVVRADDGFRTRNLHLGKVTRYQLRHIRKKLFLLCLPAQHGDGSDAARRGFEPRLSGPKPDVLPVTPTGKNFFAHTNTQVCAKKLVLQLVFLFSVLHR